METDLEYKIGQKIEFELNSSRRKGEIVQVEPHNNRVQVKLLDQCKIFAVGDIIYVQFHEITGIYKNFKVPVFWTVVAMVEVEAISDIEAGHIAESQSTLPPNGEYSAGSLGADFSSITEI